MLNVTQGSTVDSMTAVLPSVKVLSLSDVKVCLDEAINLVKCFPHLERLYVKVTPSLYQSVHAFFVYLSLYYIYTDDCSNARYIDDHSFLSSLFFCRHKLLC